MEMENLTNDYVDNSQQVIFGVFTFQSYAGLDEKECLKQKY